MTFIDKEKLPIAEQTVVVDDPVLGIKRKVIAGKRIPPDLIAAYAEKTGEHVAIPDAAAGDGSTVDYDEKPVDWLEEEAQRRSLDVVGTGANGNVIKKDLVAALQADDE